MRLRTLCACAILPFTVFAQHPTRTVDQAFASVRKSPPQLHAFLLKMPKGGDLHNHLSGAVYAETFIDDAAHANVCLDRTTLAFAAPTSGGPCPNGEPAPAALAADSDLRGQMIDSLSMRDFVPGRESAHDHFFATFAKFGAVSGSDGEHLAEVIRRAANQNESYLELMALSGGSAASALGEAAGLDETHFDVTRQKLLAAGMDQLVSALQQRVDAMEAARVQALGCSDKNASGCDVTVKYVYQVMRNSAKEQVFAQALAGVMLAAADPRVVAINFVQPEDGLVSMRDYDLHMRMVDYLHGLFPNIHLTLHAGELAIGLVPPEGLRNHITEAVHEGHAERIGHGVDIMDEDDAISTLHYMRAHHIDVEINLTSNAVILGVEGDRHPFQTYREYGVPVTISTDDEGVSRTDLTEEFERAILTYSLTYTDVKQTVRNSLEYSFAPGASYWRNASFRAPVAACVSRSSSSCKAFLQQNEKARLQADLEDRFLKFERWAAQEMHP